MEIQRKTMHLEINSAGRFDLSMESKMHGNSTENNDLGINRAGESAQTQQRPTESSAVWTAARMRIHRKTMHSGVSGAGGRRAFAKCMEIQRKTMHSGVSGAGGQRAFAKTEHRLDLSMDSNMYGNL